MQSLRLIIFCVCCFLIACTSSEEKKAARQDKYENSKLSLEEIEKKTPVEFLTVAGTDKKNILGQTVVKGKIHNHAKMVAYKDVDVRLFFYSKTGTLLQEDHETVYETIAPGTTVAFKSKYFSPKGTDSIAMKVIAAKY
jgi:hypothetical protein